MFNLRNTPFFPWSVVKLVCTVKTECGCYRHSNHVMRYDYLESLMYLIRCYVFIETTEDLEFFSSSCFFFSIV